MHAAIATSTGDADASDWTQVDAQSFKLEASEASVTRATELLAVYDVFRPYYTGKPTK